MDGLVKPLEWKDEGGHYEGRFARANAPLFGTIRCESYLRHQFTVSWSVPGYCDTFTTGVFPTLAAAKAAAQADYADRIMSALNMDALAALQAEVAALRAQVDEAVAGAYAAAANELTMTLHYAECAGADVTDQDREYASSAADFILVLTPADAQAALARIKAETRKAALREAAVICRPMNGSNDLDAAAAKIIALIEEPSHA